MPTTNPVPSQDPSDLLFNAGKLDEVLNGTGNSFTDRLGVARRTVAGMNADFDAQLADAESDLNVYRADAAASAAQALGYLNTIRTTSYGAYASDPATDPLGNPPNAGDEYFNTTSNLLKRFSGTTWQASDINTANLAAPSGSSLIGFDGGTAQDVLDNAKAMQGYTALRAYTGRATGVRITTPGIAGVFTRDGDTTTADNGGTVIADASGRRWKRVFDGAVSVRWFGALGNWNGATGADDTSAIQAAMNYGLGSGRNIFFPSGWYRVTNTISLLNSSFALSFGFFGENGNSTRIYFVNAAPLKNLFYVDSDVNYLKVARIEFIDVNPRTSRCFQFVDTRDTIAPSWKHEFRSTRVTGFKEGVRFDGGATIGDDAHESEVLFLHAKFRNNETGLIYNNTQAVNHQIIATDFENDVEPEGQEWTHIKIERGTTVNHIGGSVIGKGPYMSYKYVLTGGFQNTSQFLSKGIRVEKRSGVLPVIDHNTDSTITLSNSLRVIVEDMAISASPGATLFARFGGRTFAKFKNVHANLQMDVEAYVTANLAANSETGSIVIEDCKAINYKRISNVAAYGSGAAASTSYRSIPAEISMRVEGTTGQNDVDGYMTLNNQRQTVYQGGWMATQMKTLVFANSDTAGFGSGSNPATALIRLPFYGRPCKFRLLRDDVLASSSVVMDLYAVVGGVDYLVASITPTLNAGGHFEENIQTLAGLTYFFNDGINWDGKMKVVKSGTINAYVGLIMIDYM